MGTSVTLKRGLFHMFGGLAIPLAALFLPRTVLLCSVAAVTLIFLAFELLRLKAPSLNRWFLSRFKPLLREKEQSRLTGSSYVLISSLIAFLAFQRDIAVLALSFLAVGDAVSTMVGESIGKRKFLGKTVEGDLACLISCVVTGLAFHYAAVDVPLLTILVGSVSATLIDAISLPVNDNLTIPLFAGVVMTVMHL